MSADRYEITDTNGLRIDGIPWRERGLLVQYAAIRQQARDIAELRADYALKCTEYNDTTEFARGLIAERDELRGEIARHERNNTHIGKMFDQLRADLAAAVAARANMETDLELARIECAGLERRVKSLDESLHALVEVSEDSTIALARAALNGDDDDEETGARAGNGGDG